MESFFRFFASRHTLANLITVMILILGLNTLMKIKRDSYPIVDYGLMTITTEYQGASPEDVELNVTNKIEEELKSVSGLKHYTSVSMENVSSIMVVIDEDEKDQDKIKADIRDAVDRVTDFPPEVKESPLVNEINSGQIPVLEVGISGSPPYRDVRKYARLFEKKLEALPGISRTVKFGYQDREVKIEVIPDRIEDYHVPLSLIIDAIQKRNIRSTAGSFESFTSEKNIVTLAQFEEPLDVGEVIVRSTYDGPSVRIKDLAVISDSFEEPTVLSRVNGIPAISFIVYKTESADVIRVAERVKKLVQQTRKDLPEGLKISFGNDFSHYVKNRFRVVSSNAVIGLILVLIVLKCFLSFRAAIWISMGIPVSLLGALFLMPLFGAFLDSVTLSAMIMVIGIIVDDAIIISENIYCHRERGKAPIDAVVAGVSEVFWPVITTVSTTFVAFAPMFFMSGLFGKFIFVIPLVISLSLFVSLIEGMIALPAHLMPGLKRYQTHQNTSTRTWFEPLKIFYRSFIERVLHHRYIVLGVFLLLLVLACAYAAIFMKFVLFPSKMAEEFYVYIELPKGTSLPATAQKVTEIERIISKLPKSELSSWVARIGTEFDFDTADYGTESENRAFLSIGLSPYAKRKRTADEIVEVVRKQTDKLKGFDRIYYQIETGGPPVGKPISIRIVGSDNENRDKLAGEVVKFLEAIKGVKDIDRDDKLGKDQIEIKIDYDRLSKLGLTVADISQHARIAFDGEVVTDVRYGDEDVDFRVIIHKEARKRPKYLEGLLIPNSEGRMIPLNEVARLVPSKSYASFKHYKGERAITVQADVFKDIVSPLEVIDAVYKHFDLDRQWPGMRFIKAGETYETEESVASLTRTLLLAVVGIYFILIVLFNSFAQPLLVLAAIPFGFIGVILSLALHSEPLSFLGMLGAIGLAGVVVNDSLVLVNHLNRLKARHLEFTGVTEIPFQDLIKVVARGSTDRLRAILMTSSTTVVGLLPIAYGWGGTDPFMAPMALSLGWGLLFATPLTLLLVPSLYLISHELSRVFMKKEPGPPPIPHESIT
ncbi:MAG: efflux RND transporter permease subunit [Candidatus Omnitrophica bacterium]|nr:efflux RND transporter permease subunit [Candidatus Omnitrophota bacterium]